MAYFTEDFLNFFKELAPNNNKQWFDENRKRYHESVKTPFDIFVKDLIEAYKKIDKSIDIEPKDAIFRINRDIRFSKDKTPYKLNRSAVIAPGGRKDKTSPGMYFEFTPEHVRIYTGAYMLDKNQLQHVREYINNNLAQFNKIITDKEFVKHYGEVKGEKNARIGKEFYENAKKQPLLFNKNFYVFTTLPPETILDNNLIDIMLNKYKIALPFANFLKTPLTI